MINLKEIAKEKSKQLNFSHVDLQQESFIFEKDFRKLQSMSHGLKYPVIDLDFLKMRNSDKMPKFALFSINSAISMFFTKISFKKGSWEISIDSLGSNISSRMVRSKYIDIYEMLLEKALNKAVVDWNLQTIEMRIESEFNGIIPVEERAKIKEARSEFDEVIIIAEAERWKFDSRDTHYPPNPDPLVVGIKGEMSYLISCFDTTRIEDYIVREFTTNEEPV